MRLPWRDLHLYTNKDLHILRMHNLHTESRVGRIYRRCNGYDGLRAIRSEYSTREYRAVTNISTGVD